jgi:hypothetical protein
VVWEGWHREVSPYPDLGWLPALGTRGSIVRYPIPQRTFKYVATVQSVTDETCQLPTSDEPPLTTPVRHHSGGWPGSGSSASLVSLPANRSAALAGHEHYTFKDRGEVAGGAYNHKTMPDWRVKRHRSVMNRRADHIERKAGENQPHCRLRHGH